MIRVIPVVTAIVAGASCGSVFASMLGRIRYGIPLGRGPWLFAAGLVLFAVSVAMAVRP